MKTKNIYKLSMLLIVFLTHTSCILEDDAPIITGESIATIAELDKSGQINTFDSTGGESVNIQLTRTLVTDTKIQYTLNGVSKIAYIEAGTSELTLNFPTRIGVVNSITLVNATGLYNDVVLGENTEVTFFGANDPTPEKTVFTLSWEDERLDMDFYLIEGNQTFSGGVIDYSTGYTNHEVIELNDTEVDGLYSLYVNQHAFTGEVFCNVIISKSDGTYEIISGTVSDDQFVAILEKHGTTLAIHSLI